jgi:formate dehydrogenase subunit beta
MENLVIIGLDCFGTVTLADYKELGAGTLVLEEGSDKVRVACTVCEYPVAPVADVGVCLIGVDVKSELVLLGRTDAGKELLEKAGVGETADAPKRSSAVEELKKALEKLVAETQKKIGGWENLLAHFSDCVNCHNCKTLCPVCYCRQCFFDSDTLEVEGRRHLGAALRQGAVRMPANTLLFHMTRMNHMGLSCVGCGLCSDACPNDVDVFAVFRAIAHNAQKEFGYTPGCSLEDELPLAVYREEEFQTVGN